MGHSVTPYIYLGARGGLRLFSSGSGTGPSEPVEDIRSHPPLHREWWSEVPQSPPHSRGAWRGADWASRQVPVARPLTPA